MAKSKNPILEFDGLKVGDKVKLVGVEMPRSEGIISQISKDLKPKEVVMAFGVTLKNEYAKNQRQTWFPIYRNELIKI